MQQAAQFPVAGNKVVVNKQFNSPINLYSTQALNETLAKQTTVLCNGAIGIDFHQLAAPNLANSAVLKMLEEEEAPRGGTLKRVAWPPPPESSVITATAGQDFQYQDGETNHQVNGVTLQANPPAPLFYSPPPKDAQPKWEATPVAKWEASPVPQQQQQQQQRWEATPSVTVFSLPPKVATPPPPACITLRNQAPISQAPAPLIKSQPAIERQPVVRAAKMRGDQKWPPPEYKALKQAEESAIVTKGPAVKPRLVRKDYSSFFAQHALTPTYPGYRAPPGTQHYDDQGRPINNGNY